TTYRLELHGLRDTARWPLPPTHVTFTTAMEGGAGGGRPGGASPTPGQTPGRSRDDDEDGAAPGTDARSLPPLEARAGVTAVAGQALQLDGNALAHVTLEIGNRKTKTDRTGRFLLEEIPSGHREMLIDGR